MIEKLLGSAFESGFFPDSRWSVVHLADGIPKRGERDNAVAHMYADVAWFELGHLQVGETCVLSGRFNAQFWKIEETTIMCRIDDGRTGVYSHDSDYNWEGRRYAADRIALSLMTDE